MSAIKAGDVIFWLDGYDDMEDPHAVVLGTSWSPVSISDEEAEAALRAEGYEPDGEVRLDFWHSVVASDQYDVTEAEWHSDGSGKRTVSVLVFGTRPVSTYEGDS